MHQLVNQEQADMGHVFETHEAGKKNANGLRGRAASTGKQQGQWLNDDETAKFLRELYESDPSAGPRIVPLPEGMGQVIMPDGTILPATEAWIVPRQGGVYRTGYPIVR